VSPLKGNQDDIKIAERLERELEHAQSRDDDAAMVRIHKQLVTHYLRMIHKNDTPKEAT
jgi:hypothetical protein